MTNNRTTALKRRAFQASDPTLEPSKAKKRLSDEFAPCRCPPCCGPDYERAEALFCKKFSEVLLSHSKKLGAEAPSVVVYKAS